MKNLATNSLIIIVCLLVGVAISGLGNGKPVIVRKPLLMEILKEEKSLNRVDVRAIELQAREKTGVHLHPCPVVGYVVEGTIIFQAEGQPEKVLIAGDAFLEPANTRMLHFDNPTDARAKFVACYLLGKDDHELIKTLESRTEHFREPY